VAVSMRAVCRRFGAASVGLLMLLAIPTASYAGDIWIDKKGGIGATYATKHGARTGAYAEDYAADSHGVYVDYYRYSTSNPMYRLKDSNGSAPGTYAYAERSGYIVTMKMCVANSNPFDWQYCSSWYA